MSDAPLGPGWWQASDGRWYAPELAPGAPRSGSSTNGFAIASFVCSLFFWLWAIPGLLAIVFGLVARSQIRTSGGAQRGAGLALAGIIIGMVGIVLGAAVLVIVALVVDHCSHAGTCTTQFHRVR
jgi:hypothetical protein